MKALSIIGLILSVIALPLSFMVMDLYYYDGNEYGGYSRIGGGFILPLLFSLFFLAFSIIATVKSFKKKIN